MAKKWDLDRPINYIRRTARSIEARTMRKLPNARPLLRAYSRSVVAVEDVVETCRIAIRVTGLADSILPERRAIIGDNTET